MKKNAQNLLKIFSVLWLDKKNISALWLVKVVSGLWLVQIESYSVIGPNWILLCDCFNLNPSLWLVQFENLLLCYWCKDISSSVIGPNWILLCDLSNLNTYCSVIGAKIYPLLWLARILKKMNTFTHEPGNNYININIY